MQALLGIVWTLVILTLIVVVHEAAHALAARLCGMRVSELFVGLPFGPRISRRSRKSGIRYGVTVALLGGYTRICGMASADDERLPLALALANARGVVRTSELAHVLSCPEEEAEGLLRALCDLGSLECENLPLAYEEGVDLAFSTPARDAGGLCMLDRGFNAAHLASAAGHPYVLPCNPDEFLDHEVSHTYRGKGFWRRACVLVAGVVSNLLCAVVLVAFYLTCHGVPVFSASIAQVADGSVAQEAGIQAGDVIVAVDGQAVDATYEGVEEALALMEDGHPAALTLDRDGTEVEVTASLNDEGLLGVYYGTRLQTLGMSQALASGLSYALATGEAIAGLLIPSQATEVISQSSGVVGIVAITAQAAEEGAWELLLLACALSLSLGWLNLLPLPPLDGGKLVIEMVQALIKRPVSVRVQNALSLVGAAALTVLFFVMLSQDLGRLLTGGM